MNHRRYFPDLALMEVQTSSPHKVMVGDGIDMRPTYREYLGVAGLNKILTDPFDKEADIDRSLPSSHTYGTYWMFFGWTYTGTDGGPGMRKVGDRWTWGTRMDDGTVVTRTDDTFVCDYSIVQSPGTQWNTHPDGDGVTTQQVYQDGLAEPTDSLHVTDGLYGFTDADWGATTDIRGLEDMNFASSDTSVARYYGIKKLSSTTGEVDDRMVQVSNFGNNTGSAENPSASTGIVPREAGH